MCDFRTVTVICVFFVYLFNLTGATKCEDLTIRHNDTRKPGSHVAMGLQVTMEYTRSLEVKWSPLSSLQSEVVNLTINYCEIHNGDKFKPDGRCHNQMESVSANSSHIGGLEALKCYVVWLEATHISGERVTSTERPLASTIRVTPNCDHCDPNGSIGKECNPYTGDCDCKPNFYGLHCKFCRPGFYHHNGDLTRCDGCPCTRTRSGDDMSCSYEKILSGNRGLVRCNHCRPAYTGRLCHECSKGYHRTMHKEQLICAPCACGGFGDTQHPKGQCDNETGECRCTQNTDGPHCEKCAKGFTGAPGNCTAVPGVNKDTTEAGSTGGDPTIGAIIGVCVVIGLLVLGVLLYFAWRRYRRWKRQPGQFWTVELSPETDDLTLQAEHDWHDQYNSRDDSLLIGSTSYVGRFSAPPGEEPNPYRSITVS